MRPVFCVFQATCSTDSLSWDDWSPAGHERSDLRWSVRSVDGGAADAEDVADLGDGEVLLVVEFFGGGQFVAG